jgi:AraC-like DNA-binding protein
VIKAGAAFMLFPKIWHRYRPDESTGWDESWLELTGPTVDRLLRERSFVPTRPQLPPEKAVGLERALDAVHARVRSSRFGLDPELAARGFAVLAAWKSAANASRQQTRIHRAVELAERHLSDHVSEPVNIAALSRHLGVAYSHFRHVFHLHTGYAPWRYMTHLRLTQGKRMLLSSNATLDEIAAHLGFSSCFHFSSAFKRTFGLSPKDWRKSIVRESKPNNRSRYQIKTLNRG